MRFRFQVDPWKVCARMFCLVVLNCLVLALSSGEARGLSVDLMSQDISAELLELHAPRWWLMSERASSSMVGTIMTLLATFDEAGILPPEGTAQANQVIHGLIQLQSALMKSSSSELAAYRRAAATHWMSQQDELANGLVGEEGLTDKTLASLIFYDQEYPLWAEPQVVSALQAFNVTRVDWELIVDLFHKADAVFREQGRSIYKVYETWRIEMPGGQS